LHFAIINDQDEDEEEEEGKRSLQDIFVLNGASLSVINDGNNSSKQHAG